MIGALKIANTPTQTVFLIAHKNSFETARTTFSSYLRSNGDKALTPPYTEMREVRLRAMKTLIRCDIGRQY
jgi:hypothetical protein